MSHQLLCQDYFFSIS